MEQVITLKIGDGNSKTIVSSTGNGTPSFNWDTYFSHSMNNKPKDAFFDSKIVLMNNSGKRKFSKK